MQEDKLYTIIDKHFGTKRYESQFLNQYQERFLNKRIREQQKQVLQEKKQIEMKRKNYNTKYGCANSTVMHVVKPFDYSFNAVAFPTSSQKLQNTQEITFKISTPKAKCEFHDAVEHKLTGGLPIMPARKWRRVV
ncbi:hypothetical protein SS50377_26831 [Spironucleus salmonicida]|uniref:Uncharacterized protein n=1 Tax=Spironucleus salmonicida TaxID=348837 RepID=V6M793_9EUKA|nr:hypothetical protein SS50377_26831 [Spironucleus salmonicida]|eukprot:EST49299.1 Hypothetical protein SS50377_10523 [Spironucleus salmonicida]